MVGKVGVNFRVRDLGHVALETTPGRALRTGRPKGLSARAGIVTRARGSGVARETLALIEYRGSFGIAVGVVTSHTPEYPSAFGVTSTRGKCRTGKTSPFVVLERRRHLD